MNTDKMDAREFSKWTMKQLWDDEDFEENRVRAIASRDAYRERQVREKVLRTVKDTWPGEVGANLTAAILGTPAFERGQLVKLKDKAIGCCYEWGSRAVANPDYPNFYEPVLDREGRPVYLPVED